MTYVASTLKTTASKALAKQVEDELAEKDKPIEEVLDVVTGKCDRTRVCECGKEDCKPACPKV